MYIEHPLLGSRSIDEFIYYGDASLLKRPVFNQNKILEKFPNDCEFIIPVGYKGNDLIDYLSITVEVE